MKYETLKYEVEVVLAGDYSEDEFTELSERLYSVNDDITVSASGSQVSVQMHINASRPSEARGIAIARTHSMGVTTGCTKVRLSTGARKQIAYDLEGLLRKIPTEEERLDCISTKHLQLLDFFPPKTWKEKLIKRLLM